MEENSGKQKLLICSILADYKKKESSNTYQKAKCSNTLAKHLRGYR